MKIKDYAFICEPNTFRGFVSDLCDILGVIPRRYVGRAFIGTDICITNLCDPHKSYGIKYDAIFVDQRSCDGSARFRELVRINEVRSTLYKSITAFACHIYKPKYFLGFIVNPFDNVLHMWPAHNNFMPLFGNMLDNTAGIHSEVELSNLMNSSLPKPVSIRELYWDLLLISSIEGSMHHVLRAFTSAKEIAGSLAMPISTYEDLDGASIKWQYLVDCVEYGNTPYSRAFYQNNGLLTKARTLITTPSFVKL